MLTFSVALIALSLVYYVCRYLAHRKTADGMLDAARATFREEAEARAEFQTALKARPTARQRADLAQQIRAANPRLSRSQAIRLATEQLKDQAA
jgi:hypothetical protein